METLYEDMGNILGRYYEIKDTGSIQEKEVKNLDKPQSGGKEEYQKFFNDNMKKFGVSSRMNLVMKIRKISLIG